MRRPPARVPMFVPAWVSVLACTSAPDVVTDRDRGGAAEARAPLDPAATRPTDPSSGRPRPTDEPEPAAPAVSGLPVAADAPRFVIVARAPADDHPELVLLQDDAGEAHAAHGPTLVHLREDGTVGHDAAGVRGIELTNSMYEALEAGIFHWTPIALGGHGPQGHYFTLTRSWATRGADDAPQIYRRAQGQWRALPTHRPLYDWHAAAYGPWIEDSVVALLAFTMPIVGEEESSRPKPGSARAIAAAKPFIVLHGAPKAPKLSRRPEAFASLATGELFFAVRRSGALVVEVQTPTGTRTTTLPAIERGTLEEVALRVTAPDRALLTARISSDRDEPGFVARFDGSSWRRIETPCNGIARSPALDDAGTAYFTCPVGTDERGVLLRERGGVVEELPTPISVATVVARTADDLWVAGEYDAAGTALLHGRGPAGAPFVFPTMAEAAATILAWQPARPIDKDCTAAWATLADTVDRGAVLAQIAGWTEDFHAEAYEATVADHTEFGVSVRVWGETPMSRAVAVLRERFGKDLLATSCNRRLPATPASG